MLEMNWEIYLLPIIFSSALPCHAASHNEADKVASLYVKSGRTSYKPPLFVLYGDGTVIFARKSATKAPNLRIARIPSEKLQYERSLINNLSKASHFYNCMPEATDQPEMILEAVSETGENISIRIHGCPDPSATKRLPKEVEDAYKEFSRFEYVGAEPWLPSTVLCFPQEIARTNDALPWPGGWPDLFQSKVSLSREQFAELLRLSPALDTPFILQNKCWSLRFEFPIPPRHSKKPN